MDDDEVFDPFHIRSKIGKWLHLSCKNLGNDKLKTLQYLDNTEIHNRDFILSETVIANVELAIS